MVESKFQRMVLTKRQTSVSTPGSVDIVPYTKAFHHEQIRHLYAQAFEDSLWPRNWDKFEEFDENGVFVARDSTMGKLIGYVTSFRRKDFGYISVVAVIPTYRRKNVGSALIQKAIEYLHSLKSSQIIIDVDIENKAAIEAYKKLGFEMMNTPADS